MKSKNTRTFIASVVVLIVFAYMLPRAEPVEDSGQQPELKQVAMMYVMSREREDFNFEGFEKTMEILTKTASNPEKIQMVMTMIAILEGEKSQSESVQKSSDPRWEFLDFLKGDRPDLPERMDWVDKQSWLDMALLQKSYEKAGMKSEAVGLSVELRFIEQELNDRAYMVSFFEFMSLLGLALIIQTFFQWHTFKKTKWELFSLTPIQKPLKSLVQFLAAFFVLFILFEGVMSAMQLGIWSVVLAYLISVLVAWFLLRKFLFTNEEIVSLSGLSDIRMTLPVFLTSILGFCALLFMSKMMIFLMQQAHWPFQSVASEAMIQEMMNLPVDATALILLSCLIAPLCEELLFRGLILKTMASSMTKVQALLWSSLVFALFHPLSFFPLIFILGFCLGLIYMRGRNLMAPVLTHVLWNLLTLVHVQMG